MFGALTSASDTGNECPCGHSRQTDRQTDTWKVKSESLCPAGANGVSGLITALSGNGPGRDFSASTAVELSPSASGALLRFLLSRSALGSDVPPVCHRDV